MSADGFGILGVAALAIVATPVLIGGAVVAGGVYATGKLVSHIAEEERIKRAVRERREAEKRARLAAEETADRRRIQELMRTYTQLQEAQFSVRQDINRKFVDSYKNFSTELQRSQERLNRGADILTRNAEDDRRKLLSLWTEQTNQQAESYSKGIHSSLNNLRDKVQEEKKQFQSFKSRVAEDSRIRGFAAEQLESAKIIIKTLRIEFGYVPDSLIDGYNSAVNYYNNEMYENAYGVASSVTMECYEVLEKELVEREKKQTLADIIKMQIVELRSRLESMQKFEFDYKGERFEEDLLRFTPFANSIFLQLDEIKKKVSDVEKCDFHILTRLQHQLSDIDMDIIDCTKLAAQRLLYAYTENDRASDVTQAMEEQGYDVVGYAYEGGVEGQPIHINFENRVTHGKVTVVLSPSPQNNEIHVDVHDYGADGMADTRRQEELRCLIEKTLAISISCSNKGNVSSNVNASDLKSVEKMRIQ